MSNTTDQISLNDAVTYTTNWRNDNPGSVNSFLVSIADLQGVVDELGSDYARIYLGIDKSGTEKIMILGCNSYKQDMIMDTDHPDSKNSGIYDFSSPCPPICDDTTSPLYTGTITTS